MHPKAVQLLPQLLLRLGGLGCKGVLSWALRGALSGPKSMPSPHPLEKGSRQPYLGQLLAEPEVLLAELPECPGPLAPTVLLFRALLPQLGTQCLHVPLQLHGPCLPLGSPGFQPPAQLMVLLLQLLRGRTDTEPQLVEGQEEDRRDGEEGMEGWREREDRGTERKAEGDGRDSPRLTGVEVGDMSPETSKDSSAPFPSLPTHLWLPPQLLGPRP